MTSDNGEAGRREQILDAATGLFAERGYSLTSLMDIAEQIGITGPAIYHWFDRKDTILFEIMARTIDQAIAETEQIILQHEDPVEALAAISVAHVRRVVSNVQQNSVYRTERVHLTPVELNEVKIREAQYESLMHDVYRKGVATGELLEVDVRIGIGTFLGGCRWAHRVLDTFPKDRLIEEIPPIVMRSILVHPDDPRAPSVGGAATAADG